MWPIICKVVGVALLLLGAHGLYIYANPISTDAGLGNLFTELDLHIAQISRVIRWMSVSALHSWIVPTAFLIMGFFLVKVRGE